MTKFDKRNHPKKDNLTKLKQVDKLKKSIIDMFQQDRLNLFYKKLDYLQENQAEDKELLAKSLCDITKQIPNNNIKLELFAEALEANPTDTVTLNSYATALANNNQFEKAFELFEQSKNIKP
ncbi:MAG: tetratricopeptide repeat protein, partial [Candidatus Marithrix sp.]